MTRTPLSGEKPIYWIGSSLKDISRFPSEVQRTIGFALSAAQFGGKHPSAKPWKGEGTGVFEIVKDHDGDTYREFTPFALQMPFTCCTPFKRSLRMGFQPGNRTLR
jgi:phage-related protein